MSTSYINGMFTKFKYEESDIKTIENFIHHQQYSYSEGAYENECKYDIFFDIPSIYNYDFNDFILKGVKSKSFYILFEGSILESKIYATDIYYIVISDNYLYFLRTDERIDDYKIMLTLTDCMGCIYNNDSFDSIRFVEFIRDIKKHITQNRSKLSKKIKSRNLNESGYILYKLNPNLLYTEYNMNLFKLRLLKEL